jgi:hypothetical protein
MITTFDIGGGADAKRFTLAGNKLTFKATAFSKPPGICTIHNSKNC